MDDLFQNLLPPEPSPPTEKTCTKNLLGTGEFRASRADLKWMLEQDSEWRIEGLARYVLQMPSKDARRRFLDGFEAKHGREVGNALRTRIIALHKQRDLGLAAAHQTG